MKFFSKKKIFIGVLFLILLITIVILVLFINNKEEKLKNDNEIIELKFESRIEELNNLKSEDFYKIGWLQVQGTNIDFPIFDYRAALALKNMDNSYGWRSPIYVTDENREVLIGHNIINVSSTPMLSNENMKNFEALMSFSYAGFAKDNLYIQYTKNGKDELYAIYAIGFYDYNYDKAESMNNPETIKNYIKKTRDNSIYDYDIEVNENDDLLTVKTCTRYFGLDEKQQFIIDARKVRKDEKIIKYNVSTNKLFEELIETKEES